MDAVYNDLYGGTEDDVRNDAETARQFEPWRVVVCGSRTWGGSWKPGAKAHSVENLVEVYSLHSLLTGLLDDAIMSMCGATDAHGRYVLTVVHGGCPTGADALAAHWATGHDNVRTEVFPADWDTYGRRAGPIRNQAMIDSLDPDRLNQHLVVAAWDGKSRGTLSTIRFARKANIPVITLGVNPDV